MLFLPRAFGASGLALLIGFSTWFALFTAGRASAETLFTVNNLADTLVAIDSATGQTTTVGPIGYDMHNVDLADMDGVIYGVTSNSDDIFNRPGWTLLAIDRHTGAMISHIDLSFNASMPSIVEGLAAVNGKLYIGFSPDDTVSGDLAELNPVTGVISHDVNYSQIPGANNFFGSFGVDLDGLGGEPGKGTIVALDGDQNLISLARIDPVNVTVQGVKQFTLATGINDVAVTSAASYLIGNGSLYIMDLNSPNANPVVQTLALSPVGSFVGLSVPEPSTAWLAAC